MKKIYTLALAMLFGASAFAQVDETFVFTDAAGDIIPDGSTITVNNYEIDEFDTQKFDSGLFMKNNSTEQSYLAIEVNITKIDNGSISICFPVNCMSSEIFGRQATTSTGIIKSEETKSLQSEWLPVEKGNCTVTYTINIMKLIRPVPVPTYEKEATGATVAVNYVYDDNSQDVTGIKDISTGNVAKNGIIYNLAGQKIDANYKGIAIKNGKKFILK